MFTLPHELNSLARRQPALVYRLLFKAASQTLLEFGRNPRWLGGEIGVTMVLHTWGQNLGEHIHVHAIVTGGALSPDRERWLPARGNFLFPTRALSSVFRGKYLDFLAQAHRGGELRLPGTDGIDDANDFDCLKTALRSHDWVVYTKPPFAGAAHVLAYLGRYTHKIAIANHRLVDFDGEHVRSDGATTPTAIGARPCVSMPTSSSGGSCRMSCRAASPGSAITACSPIAAATASSPCAGP